VILPEGAMRRAVGTVLFVGTLLAAITGLLVLWLSSYESRAGWGPKWR
jgi:hypothetical protein